MVVHAVASSSPGYGLITTQPYAQYDEESVENLFSGSGYCAQNFVAKRFALRVCWNARASNNRYNAPMPCLPTILAIFFPRLVIIGIAIFTNWFNAAFESALWPILGFLFMPYTTLAYTAAMLNNHHSVNGGWLVLVVIAVLVDLGGQGSSARGSRRRRR